MTSTKRIIQGILWIGIYLLITIAPLLTLVIGPRPAGREFLRDFSVGLGFSGFAMLGLQFILTARFKVLKAPYGSDIVYFFHRQISIVTFALIAAHPILLFINDPKLLELLSPFTDSLAARFGVSAVLATAALIIFSIWRKNLRIEYDRWRIWHGLLAIAAVLLAIIHIELRGYYLNTLWKQLFWGFYGIFWIGVLAWVRVIKPVILIQNAFLIEKIIPERGNAWTLVLHSEKNKAFNFQPGQFAWITVKDTPFRDHEHPFSLSSSAEEKSAIAFTIKELGDFTSSIKHLEIGEKIYVDGPFGAFTVDRCPNAKQFAFIAGRVGITPIMSMLRTLADRGDTRQLTLIYANKTLEAATFIEEIDQLPSRLNLKIVHVVEAPSDAWTGESGYVNAEILQRWLPSERLPNDVEVFVCGPNPMMDAVEKALAQLGFSAGDIHSERFNLV